MEQCYIKKILSYLSKISPTESRMNGFLIVQLIVSIILTSIMSARDARPFKIITLHITIQKKTTILSPEMDSVVFFQISRK